MRTPIIVGYRGREKIYALKTSSVAMIRKAIEKFVVDEKIMDFKIRFYDRDGQSTDDPTKVFRVEVY